MVTLIGSLAATLTAACWLPQMVKTLRLGTADDFAWPYLVMLMFGLMGWIMYGFFRHDPPIYVCNIVTALLVAGVVVVKVRSEQARRHLADEVAAIVSDLEV
ncbi:MAG TPA: PQ-loop domain-containing transporter [Acidimicrobiales bacterium]